MNIVDYISPERILILKGTNKESVLKEMIQISGSCLYDEKQFSQAIFKREALLSTGVGFETAFPHSKTNSVIDFFVTIGISQRGIDWQSVDERPVKLVFLIGGPLQDQNRYLKILAALSKIANKDEKRQIMLTVDTPDDFYNEFCKSALQEIQAI